MVQHEPGRRPDADPEHPIVLEPRRARAGRRGLPVLYVLLWSIALVVVIFAVLWFTFYPHVHG